MEFAGGEGPLRKEIEKEFHFQELTYCYEHAGRETYFTWDSLKTLKQLSNIVEKWKPDCIHAFDARSYILATIAEYTEAGCGELYAVRGNYSLLQHTACGENYRILP